MTVKTATRTRKPAQPSVVSVRKPRLGEILVREGYLTPEQLKKALQIKKEQKLYAPLGEVCVSEGFLSRCDLRRVLSEHHKNIPLGELLI
ncbi:MAG: hypothetical protein D6743_09285, partial [Calditrichaeota bacterium]